MRYILIILPMTIYFFINAIIICLCSYSRHALLFFSLFFHILKLKVVSQITERKYMWKWYIQGVMPHCYNSFFAWKKVEETSAEVIGSRLTFSFQISFYFIHLLIIHIVVGVTVTWWRIQLLFWLRLRNRPSGKYKYWSTRRSSYD